MEEVNGIVVELAQWTTGKVVGLLLQSFSNTVMKPDIHIPSLFLFSLFVFFTCVQFPNKKSYAFTIFISYENMALSCLFKIPVLFLARNMKMQETLSYGDSLPSM